MIEKIIIKDITKKINDSKSIIYIYYIMINIVLFINQKGNLFLIYNYKIENYINRFSIDNKYNILFVENKIKNMLNLKDFINKYRNLHFLRNLFDYIKELNPNRINYNINKYHQKEKLYKTVDITNIIFNLCKNEKYFYCFQPKLINNIKIVDLPSNFILYKGFSNINNINNTNNINNLKASKEGWFSTKEVAKMYGKVFRFKTIRKLRLFVLNDFDNLKILFNKINFKIQNYMKTKKINYVKMKEHLHDMEVLRITTGIYCTYFRQKQLLENFDRHVKQKLTRKVKIKNYSKQIFKINNNKYSNLYLDLNRISIATYVDILMLKMLNKYFNIDGYISYKVPSLWEFGEWSHKGNNKIPYLDEEIALNIQRGSVIKN